MQSKAILNRRLLIKILAGIALSLSLILIFLLTRPVKTGSAPIIVNSTALQEQAAAKQTQANSSLPVRLMIPKIKVDAAIDPVGIMSNEAMEAPSTPQSVGWFKFGPYPGDSGSAVIDGHFGRWPNGQGSVFDNLSKLKNGDNVSVVNARGITTTFIVRAIQVYSQNDDASAIFKSSDGAAYLNLITCEGIWNKKSKSYSNRLVVFTDRI